MENQKEKLYVFANWGDRVTVIGDNGQFLRGVITEFDLSDVRNTKVVYRGGGYDWYNRDQVEEDCKTFEYANQKGN